MSAAKLKVKEPVGQMPVLQFCALSQLMIDPAYQRSTEETASQRLIRAIAIDWNWTLFQPLTVARRANDNGLYVIDGQHRLAAAKLRTDINQLPCVVVDSKDAVEEAAKFVLLNTQRRALTGLEVFNASLASRDPEAVAIHAAMTKGGLILARHMCTAVWPIGWYGQIGTVQRAWRSHGPELTALALSVMGKGFSREPQINAGTIFPGVVGLLASEERAKRRMSPTRFDALSRMLGEFGQAELRRRILQRRAMRPDDSAANVATEELLFLWADADPARNQRLATPVEPQLTSRPLKEALFREGRAWCSQCEQRVDRARAQGCMSKFCKMVEA